MPQEIEVFKLVLNGGSFALIVVLVLWVLFKASPAIKATIEHKDATHAATVQAMTLDFRNTLTAVSASHQSAMTAMAQAHQEAISSLAKEFRETYMQQAKECREERAELLKRSDENDKADREARHKQGDLFQHALAESHEHYRRHQQ